MTGEWRMPTRGEVAEREIAARAGVKEAADLLGQRNPGLGGMSGQAYLFNLVVSELDRWPLDDEEKDVELARFVVFAEPMMRMHAALRFE